jgi:hypothetical protein
VDGLCFVSSITKTVKFGQAVFDLYVSSCYQICKIEKFDVKMSCSLDLELALPLISKFIVYFNLG